MSEILKGISEALHIATGTLKNRNTCAIIVAAGSGTRMGSATPKQFMLLDGKPVVVHSLLAYEASEYIRDIIVVCRPEDNSIYEDYKKEFGITKLIKTVVGGDTRQKSVLNGIEAVKPDISYVAIADAARPLITKENINSVALEAYRYEAATAAFPAVDTVKVADKGFITETVERSTVWNATTPQMFNLNVYRAAAYSCREEGFTGTDDNSLVEHIGYNVKLVDCGRLNIKITEQSDLLFAQAILNDRKNNQKGN